MVIGYALLGATWLVWKTEGAAQAHARRMASRLGAATLAALLAQRYWTRWIAFPGVLLTAQVPVLTLVIAAGLFWSLRTGRERLPFVAALGLFLLSFAGLGVSIYPYVVPRAVTIWDAAAPASSQLFMLVGAAVIIPLILVYTAWAYWVFRGKVGAHGYH